jgi:DNA-binding transcriptional LysR family regulator
MLDWTDLRFLLAVQRAKTLSAAARKLGCNQTTVGRRIEALESALDRRLFRRTPDGYFPTPDGEAALTRAERIEEEVMAMEREIGSRDERPEGQVRRPPTSRWNASGIEAGGFASAIPKSTWSSTWTTTR